MYVGPLVVIAHMLLLLKMMGPLDKLMEGQVERAIMIGDMLLLYMCSC